MEHNYQKICSDILKNLPQRTTEVIERRFGLRTEKRETLEAIGKSHNITRERVRQIEKEGFGQIGPKIKEHQKVFQYFNKTLKSFGDLKKEEDLLRFLGGEKFQNHALFLLTIGGDCVKASEDENFYALWMGNKEAVDLAQKVIKLTVNNFVKKRKPLTLNELFETQKRELSKILGKRLNKNIFISYLDISKKIQKNYEGEFGLNDWLEINPRGVKDKAYLVLKKETKPLHFSQIATFVAELPFPLQKKTHIATIHNELIKDQRFVLVGRGLYALKEWGYESGVVKDIIFKTLKASKKSLSKKEILEKVLEQRFVKENTVLLNLQDKKYFLKDSQGKYTIKEA